VHMPGSIPVQRVTWTDPKDDPKGQNPEARQKETKGNRKCCWPFLDLRLLECGGIELLILPTRGAPACTRGRRSSRDSVQLLVFKPMGPYRHKDAGTVMSHPLTTRNRHVGHALVNHKK
jgi:hypothetical protein